MEGGLKEKVRREKMARLACSKAELLAFGGLIPRPWAGFFIKIRRIWHDNEWFYSVVDIVEALTESPSPRQYWGVLKQRESQLLTICLQLKLESADGKKYSTDCVNTKNAFRLIQSIPSPKAEPFKMWLAEVGKERLDEIENPELAQERIKKLYEKKGYPKDWIDKRLRGIAIRQDLTDEWKDRGLTHAKDYAILTAEISQATFGMTPSKYKKFKNIPNTSKANLRDNMTDLELIFTMLGEKVTTEISVQEKPSGMPKNKKVAQRGGGVAGNARKLTEKELGRSVISKETYLQGDEKKRLNEVGE
ncbi:MAG: Bro-N domain-containing protein [Candidatus Gracilibacteria bacterium]|nr:Bro-N domain-containing protein [Candidatus Gracilibacteria bacterium]